MEENKIYLKYDKEVADRVNKEAQEQANLKEEQINKIRQLVNNKEKGD